MQIFLTGGAGMVGRNVAEHARAAGHNVVAPPRAALDLADARAVHDYLSAGRFDCVIHVAGRVGGIAENMAQPVDFLLTNFEIGRNVIKAAAAAAVPRLLNLASSCVYPRDREDPLTEDMILAGPLEPTNEGYAIAKIAILRLCEYISREHPSLSYKTAIPCNVYGTYDKFDPVRAHLVPAIIAKLTAAKAANSPTVEIWGDGRSRREFMYAEDLADFIWEAVERFDDLPELINVGMGSDHDINTFYEEVADIIGWHGTFSHDLSKPAGMRRKLVDTRRLREFGWMPRVSLAEGVQRTYDYYLRTTSAASSSLNGNAERHDN